MPWSRSSACRPEVVALGGSYLRILLLFNVPFTFGVVVSMGVRGAGDVRTPLLIGVVLNVVNVIFNYGLVYGRLGMPEAGNRRLGAGHRHRHDPGQP